MNWPHAVITHVASIGLSGYGVIPSARPLIVLAEATALVAVLT